MYKIRQLTKKTTIFIVFFSVLSSCSVFKKDKTTQTQRGSFTAPIASEEVTRNVAENYVEDKKNSVLGAIVHGVIGGAAGAYIGNQMDIQAELIREEVPGTEVTRVGEGINITFNESAGVYFATGKSSINQQSRITLNKLAEVLRQFPDTDILVEGHTDSMGAEDLNLSLSEKRAKSVSDYLINGGLSSIRFTTRWYGELQPKYSNKTTRGRAKNRRIEIGIVANEKLKKEARKKSR